MKIKICTPPFPQQIKNKTLPIKSEEEITLKEKFYQQTLTEDNERMDIIGQNGNDGLHYDLIDDDDFEVEDEILNEPEVEPREENDPRPYSPDLEPTSKDGIKVK